MTAPTFPDDAAELAAISTTIRPIVDTGKGRALALQVVIVALSCFKSAACLATNDYLYRGLCALEMWLERAQGINTGRENEPPPPCEDCGARASCKHRHIRPPYTLLDVAGIAERIASMARHTPMFQPMGQERLIVYDLATALRRACECETYENKYERIYCEAALSRPQTEPPEKHHAQKAHDRHEHTAAVLLPLLIRDLRRLCTSARVDPAPIEAAIARFGGTPS